MEAAPYCRQLLRLHQVWSCDIYSGHISTLYLDIYTGRLSRYLHWAHSHSRGTRYMWSRICWSSLIGIIRSETGAGGALGRGQQETLCLHFLNYVVTRPGTKGPPPPLLHSSSLHSGCLLTRALDNWTPTIYILHSHWSLIHTAIQHSGHLYKQ